MERVPEPKTLVDSVLDGAVELIGFYPRTASKLGSVLTDYANNVNRELDDIKARTPDRPEVIAKAVVGIVVHTARAGIGSIKAVAEAGKETVDAVESQVRRTVK